MGGPSTPNSSAGHNLTGHPQHGPAPLAQSRFLFAPAAYLMDANAPCRPLTRRVNPATNARGRARPTLPVAWPCCCPSRVPTFHLTPLTLNRNLGLGFLLPFLKLFFYITLLPHSWKVLLLYGEFCGKVIFSWSFRGLFCCCCFRELCTRSTAHSLVSSSLWLLPGPPVFGALSSCTTISQPVSLCGFPPPWEPSEWRKLLIGSPCSLQANSSRSHGTRAPCS